MARPWGKIGAWADDSEAAAATAVVAAPPAAAPLPVEAFPSLGEAAATKTNKKKKGQTVSLSEFASGKYVGPGAKRSSGSAGIFSDSDRLTSDELLMLPTGPKDRSDEEPYEGGRLGGGFRDYGGFRGDRDRERGDRGDRDREQRGFGFDREREASRADDSSDWSSNKPSRGGGRFEDDNNRRYSGDRFGGDRDLPSKADEVDNWAAGKKVFPERRGDDFGKGSFGKADADDNWGANKRPPVSDKWSFRRSDDYGGPDSGDKWNRKSDDEWGARKSVEEPRRPRLNLQPRTLPVENSPPPAPTDNAGQLGTLPEAQVEAPVESKPRQKVDPFGNAKPREVLLEQRGQDWRKMDLELETKRPDTEEEKKLKGEIVSLKELADETGDPAVKEQLAEKEQELEQLIKEMDSKVRVSTDRWMKEEPRKPSFEQNDRKRDPWKRVENEKDRPKSERW